MMIQRILLIFVGIALIALNPAPALAQATVRILFYTGNVTVGGGKASIGQQLASRDVVKIGSGGSLQLSINGKVMKYDKAGNIKVSDAIKRAGSGENNAVANTVRTLASASGASKGSRSSQAGATRLDDSSEIVEKTRQQVLSEARTSLNDELSRRTGIDNPLARAERLVREVYGEDDMVILEPRSTAVTSDPIHFRWLRSPSSGGYIVAVQDYLGNEIFRKETTDTFAIWSDAKLIPEAIYTWKLIDARNSLHRTGANFYRLNDADDASMRQEIQEIRKELGADNPALPLVLGAFYADKRCYGEATRFYLSGAATTSQHSKDFIERAADLYQYTMYLKPNEMLMIYGK